MALNNDLRKQIFEAIVRGVQRNGERIFSTSMQTDQCFVPV